MYPCDPRREYFNPMGRFMNRIFDDMMGDMGRQMRSIAPYWLDQPLLQECNIGNAVGKMVDTDEKFAVEVNVAQFRPDELSVNVRDNELLIEGHHEERSDQNGKIERHFVRKYTIPEGTQMETLESNLSDQGVLSVTAKKSTPGLPPSRSIPIKAAPRTKKENSAEKSV